MRTAWDLGADPELEKLHLRDHAHTFGLPRCSTRWTTSGGSSERPAASVAEIRELIAAMQNRLRAAIAPAAWCQLRRGELLALRRRDLDLEHQLLRVSRSFVYLQDGSIVAKEPKTKSGRRTITIPDNVLDVVRLHLDELVDRDGEALVFTGEKGGPLRPNVLGRAWEDARRRIGRLDPHLHDLRHTGLTLLAAQGATLAELMHRAGHASPAAALRYQHATIDRDRVLASALAGLDRSSATSRRSEHPEHPESSRT